MKWIGLLMILTRLTFAEESAADLAKKLDQQRELNDVAVELLERHSLREQASKPGGRIKPLREKLSKLLDKLEALAQAKEQGDGNERAELGMQIDRIVKDIQAEAFKTAWHYDHEFDLALKKYKELRPAKLDILKEFRANILTADKVVANPKMTADEVKKAVDVERAKNK